MEADLTQALLGSPRSSPSLLTRAGTSPFIEGLQFPGLSMAEELRIGSVTQDFALRVVAPGALIFFLLAIFSPRTLTSVSQSPVAGAFGFLVLGTVSYVLYRGLYVGVLSRSPVMAPQLALARRLMEHVTQRREPWALIRAVYIEWREMRAADDPRMKYVSRLAPYVHSGYQSGLIFLGFGIFVAFVSYDLLIGVGLAVLGGGVFLAAAVEDRVLDQIETDLLAGGPEGLTTLLHQIRPPPRPPGAA